MNVIMMRKLSYEIDADILLGAEYRPIRQKSVDDRTSQTAIIAYSGTVTSHNASLHN